MADVSSPFSTDEVLWYAPPGTIWGDLGYACPNFGINPTSLNSTITTLVANIGANLFSVMAHSDADSRTPPSINTLIRIHKLITRARTIISGRAIAAATPRMEPTHATPSPEAFLLFPCPYFKVRNMYMKEWAGLIFNALGEAMQHTENRVEFEISTSFGGLVLQYLQRVYIRMATELFMVPLATAQDPAFTLDDKTIASYDPSKYFTSTELVDTVPPLGVIPTENDLSILRAGIPANMIVGLSRYPTGGNGNVFTNPTIANMQPVPMAPGGVSDPKAATTVAAPATNATGSFIPAPTP